MHYGSCAPRAKQKTLLPFPALLKSTWRQLHLSPDTSIILSVRFWIQLALTRDSSRYAMRSLIWEKSRLRWLKIRPILQNTVNSTIHSIAHFPPLLPHTWFMETSLASPKLFPIWLKMPSNIVPLGGYHRLFSAHF